MKKITLRIYLLCGCLFLATGIKAATNEVPMPSFVKIEKPVPGETSQGEDEGKADQFFHIRNSHAAWGDYNNDGFLDVYYSGRNQHVNWWTLASVLYTNNGDGTFSKFFENPYEDGKMLKGGYYSCPMWIDFNNDGLLDLLIGGLNWEDNGFTKGNGFAHLFQNMGPNEDGDYIFVEIPDGGGIRRFNNEGSGGKSHQFISVGDYDKDGYLDVIVTGFGRILADENKTEEEGEAETERMVRLYKNDNGMGFIEQELPLNGNAGFDGLTGGSVVFADMDRDGWLDIVCGGYSDNGGQKLHVYWNDKAGSFTENLDEILMGSYNSGCGVMDLNNDGLMDIVVTGFAPNKDFFIYKNLGNRSFELITKDQAGLEGLDGGQLDFGDINHDGLTDILVGGHGEVNEISTWVYLNKGDGTFEKLLNPAKRVSHGSQNLIDFNNDGRLDIFVLGWTNSGENNGDECTAGLWENKIATVNEAPSTPTNLKGLYDDENKTVTFTWDASTDDLTPQEALQYNIYLRKQGGTETFMTVPADTKTGFIKVGEISGQIMTNTYTMTVEGEADDVFEWGVQAIDNGKRASQFESSTFGLAGTSISLNTASGIQVSAFGNVINYDVDEEAVLVVVDASGKIIVQKTVSGAGSISNLNKGFYIVKVTSKTGNITKSVIL